MSLILTFNVGLEPAELAKALGVLIHSGQADSMDGVRSGFSEILAGIGCGTAAPLQRRARRAA